jgi:hypothetical protein
MDGVVSSEKVFMLNFMTMYVCSKLINEEERRDE